MAEFNQTRWSLVSAIRGENQQTAQEALEELCRIYRPAILSFAQQALRDMHEAEDLTQEFFSDFLQKGRIEVADKRDGKFRTYLLAHFKFVLLDHLKAKRAAKRGGGQHDVSIEEMGDHEGPTTCPDDGEFDRAWAMSIVRETVRLLEVEESARKGDIPFSDLKGFLPGFQSLVSTTYPQLSAKYGVAEGTLRVRVVRMRDRFKELLNSVLSDTVGNISDLESERKALLGGMLKSI